MIISNEINLIIVDNFRNLCVEGHALTVDHEAEKHALT